MAPWFFHKVRLDHKTEDLSAVTPYEKVCWFLKHQFPWQGEGPVTFADTGIPPDFPADLRIVSVGDLLYQGVEYRLDAFLPQWRERFGEALRIGNLETPLALSRPPSTPRSIVHFNASPTFWDQIQAMGFHVLSVANNHAFDMGEDGLRETCARLEEAEVLPIGSSLVPRDTLEWRGRRVGFLATTYGTNREPFLPTVDRFPSWRPDAERFLPPVLDRIRALRERSDLVVLAMHWGHECETHLDPRLRDFALAFVEAGADLVLGHHPHVAQPSEKVTRADGSEALVLHSQGNFVCRGIHPLVRTGYAFDIRVALDGGRTRIAYDVHKVRTRRLTMKTRFL